MDKNHIDEYIQKQVGLTPDNKGFNIDLINGRLKEADECIKHLERIRNNYACEVMQEWSDRLPVDFPDLKKCEDIKPCDNIYTGVCIPFGNIPDAIAIRIQMENRNLYYGVTYMPETKGQRSQLQEALSFVNNNGDFIKGSDWLYYKFTSYNDGYDALCQLINIFIKH